MAGKNTHVLRFRTSDKDLSVKDFFLQYQRSLPKLVMVTQGQRDGIEEGSDVTDRRQVHDIVNINRYSVLCIIYMYIK